MPILRVELEVEKLNEEELKDIIEKIKDIDKVKKINIYEYRA